MKFSFTKMQGCGNDYVYLDCRAAFPAEMPRYARLLADRHFGVGGDGAICICQSQKADGFMRMFNADGSEGRMCGNGIRCVAQWLYEQGVRKEAIAVETLDGVKLLHRAAPGVWRVDMGAPRFEAAALPALGFGEKTIDAPLLVNGKEYSVTLVSMGNPHCVIEVEEAAGLDLGSIGPGFERHPAFSQGVNTEFVRRIGPTELEMRVWERGSGETMACGTGATAAAAAFVARGKCPAGEEITVHLLGGDLSIRVDGATAWMTGPAVTVFTGEIELA